MSDIVDDFEALIGRRPTARQAFARPNFARGGSERGLSYDIRWDDARATAGTLRLMVEGHPVWGDEEDGLRLTWDAFLFHLSDNWTALLFEQAYPTGLTPAWPSELESFADRVSAGAVSEAGAFRQRHDLSAWTVNPKVVPFWIVREGSDMLLDVGERRLRWPAGDIVRSLVSLGSALARRLGDTRTRLDLVDRWNTRDDVPDVRVAALATGQTEERVRGWIGTGILPSLPSRTVLLQDLDEVMAAARMLGPQVEDRLLSTISSVVRASPKQDISELDLESREAIDELSRVGSTLPHREGQHLAGWLRQRVGRESLGSVVDVHAILQGWNVGIVEVSVTPDIEAICCWGPGHGPVVLYNKDGARNRAGACRATLAHEICHLLVDRGRSLPVVDVLGGSAPVAIERRAKAFAAELLVPMEWAAHVYRGASSVSEAVGALMRDYRVTRSLAALQLVNYEHTFGGLLSEADGRWLRETAGLDRPVRR